MFRMGVSRAIDVMHLGRDRVICAYQVGSLVVDPGPTSSVHTLLESLDGMEPEALLLTHVHLDHAGAAGALCRRFPELVVYVHEVGAPHLVDPSKLLKSARGLYGDDMDRLWGEVAPVPEERVRRLSGGETVHGLRVAYTPGHASHHVSYLHEDSGEAFVGDMAGVRIPPHEYTLAPTPPPDIDVEAWLESLHTIASWNPRTLCLTHFGPVPEVEDQLMRARESLLYLAETARGVDEAGFERRLERTLRESVDGDTAASFLQAMPLPMCYQGLERYWRKRAKREESAA
jgi:glyoxylase-like metal-dependent hydrolase (beta-lactamase superfamily II)